MKWEHLIFVTILIVGMAFSVLKTNQKPQTKTRNIQTQDSSVHIKEMAASAGH